MNIGEIIEVGTREIPTWNPNAPAPVPVQAPEKELVPAGS